MSSLLLYIYFDSIKTMDTITIPKKIASKGDLVIMSRKEYEALLEFKKFREFSPTAAQKKALTKARKNLARGKYLTLGKLRHELGFTY